MSVFPNDLRFALRMFAKNPGTTAVAMLSLALAIGPNAALFSVVDRLLLRPPPVPGGSEIFRLDTFSETGIGAGASYPDYLDYQAAVGPAAQIIGHGSHLAMVTTPAGPKFVPEDSVTENYFHVLGAKPAAGRTLVESDHQFSGAPPMMMSYSLWQREFGGDPSIVGRPVTVNGMELVLVGIAPRGFRTPGITPLPVDIWLPVSFVSYRSQGRNDFLMRRDNREFKLWARLPDPRQKPRVEAILSSVAARLARDFPRIDAPQRAVLTPSEALESGGRTISAFLLTLVGLVLLIACANIAGVLLAQGEGRRREFAVRLAVGAGRGRLVRQLLTESLLLSLVGAAGGLLMAMWLLVGLPKILPPLPFSLGFDVRLDGRVLAYALLLSCAAALACSLAPALRMSRTSLAPSLQGAATGGRAHFWFRSGLLVGQIAVCQFLLAGAFLLTRSYIQLEHLRPGFDTDRKLLLATVVDMKERTTADYRSIADALQSLPGVGQAAWGRKLPLGLSGGESQAVTLPGSAAQPVAIPYNTVSPNFFAVMGTRFLYGGPARASGEAAINEQMARRFWGSAGAAMGRFFRAGDRELQVAGVVENGKYFYLLENDSPYLFLPAPASAGGEGALAIEIHNRPEAAAAAVRNTLRTVAPDINTLSLTTMDQHMRLARLPQEAGAGSMGALGLTGVFLAGVGLYGLMAFRVRRRAHEIAVRMALGARPAGVLALVLRESLTLVALGAAIGLALAIAAAHVLSVLLYQVGAADPLALAAAAGSVAAVAALAAFRPARRAIRIDPMATLRAE